ncbi:phage terminase large subunit family protein [Thiobacillus denitrificans]|uniref:phage terminase large subunit family protein n=1 Tax=Thiobacillus denitrificans TaxID=36861 RepID=UPI000757D09A|nr:phage terminase large subunit family protein [Thiobacillus denitrificans]
MPLADAYALVGAAWADGLSPDPDITFDAWAEEFRYLPPDSSEPGKFRLSRTPFMRDILRDLSPSSEVEEVVLVKGGQISGSETANNFIGATVHLAPGRCLFVQPTVDAAKDYVRERINPLMEYTPVLKGRVSETRSRDGSNTVKFKRFPGGFLAFAGANSAQALQSRAIRYLVLDEIDRYPRDVDGQGDPVGMAVKRTDTFRRNRKIFKLSTPGNKDESRIMKDYAETDQRRYFMPCPHCAHMDYFRRERLRWPANAPREATMTCHGCGGEIEERHKTHMMDPASGAEWRATAVSKDPRKRGYHVPGLYSPLGWRSWGDIAQDLEHAELLASRGDNALLKKVVNLDLGEPYEDQGERTMHAALKARAEPYEMRTAPRGGLILTSAVDVQHNRLEGKIMAWGRQEECWVVDYQVFWGDPMQAAIWQELDAWLLRPLRYEVTGAEMRIAACAIDASDGHTMEEVYKFVRPRTGRMVFAIKGHKTYDAPMLPPPSAREIDRSGVKVKTGDLLWMVGVNQIKNVLSARLRVETPGRNCIHFGTWLPENYWPMLASEKLVSKFLNGNVYKRWVKIEGERNEGWDLLVYNYAAAIRLGVNRWGEANWLECERILTQSSLFAAPVDGEEEPDPYCRPPDLGEDAPVHAAVEAEEQAEAAVAVRAAPPRPVVLPGVPPPARPVTQPVRRAVARSAYLR